MIKKKHCFEFGNKVKNINLCKILTSPLKLETTFFCQNNPHKIFDIVFKDALKVAYLTICQTYIIDMLEYIP